MIKISISYFYNLRFFKPYQIPLSTAVWDPKWYHNWKGNNEVFVDNNGVLNGLRVEELNPQKCNADGCPCSLHKLGGDLNCPFHVNYRKGLRKVNLQTLLEKMNVIATGWKNTIGFSEDPEIILLVYETPDNPCSERADLINWFAENGIEVKEWEKLPD